MGIGHLGWGSNPPPLLFSAAEDAVRWVHVAGCACLCALDGQQREGGNDIRNQREARSGQ